MIHVVGTCDTKGEEIAWLRDLIVARGQPAVIVDLGTRAPKIVPDIPARQIAACHPGGVDAVLGGTDRGAAVSAMGSAFAAWCSTRAAGVSGIIAVGGHLLAPKGRLLAMKGLPASDEIAELPAGWAVAAVHPLHVPGLVGERHLVEITRSPTEPA